jgi:hypothetical protein
MNLTGSSSNSQNRGKKGFALILTLALISFVFLLVITLVNQVRMEFSFTESRQNQVLAKAHARMGMMIAIGEIQKHLGPDTRVSATADIYDERIDSGKKYYDTSRQEYGFFPNNENEQFLHLSRIKYPGYDGILENNYPSNNLESVDLYRDEETYPYPENNEQVKRLPLGQRQWTGVWKHRGHGSDNYLSLEGSSRLATRDLPFNSDKGSFISDTWLVDTSYDHHPAVEQAWLVSGNEGWQKKLAILNNNGNLVADFIEIPDGRYIDDDGFRVIPESAGNYGNYENPWTDHEKVVLEMNRSGNYFHPLVALPDPADESNNFKGSEHTTWLLKQPLLNEKYDSKNSFHQANWKNYLVAEPVKVLKTPIISTENTQKIIDDNGWEERAGSYAYWVGDEGVKAKINIMEPFTMDGEKVKSTLDESSPLMVASSPNLQKGSFGFDFTPGSKTDDEKRKDLIVPLSVKDLLDEENFGDTDAIAANYFYHSITTDSYGVLADVRTGGLKRDLSLAFIDDETSQLWRSDFNNNWIYRDRVEALKNFPIFAKQSKVAFGTSKIHKNQWFDSAEDATVEDRDAMLAGPQWSVLADFYKISGTNADLNMTAPSTFPRTVGDNALIFNPGESPRSPAGAMPRMANDDTYRFFNSFSDKYGNSIRPEPSNHAVTPILTRLKMTFYPMISNADDEIEIAVNPTVILWNPYSKPMRIENLYAFLPMNKINIQIFEMDLLEYELFRKWWMYVSGKEKARFRLLGSSDELSKDFNQPWPLLPNKYSNWGILQNMMGRVDNKTGTEPTLTKTGSSFKFIHQNPRFEDDEFWLMREFVFKNCNDERFQLDSFVLKLIDTTIQPGESITYSAAGGDRLEIGSQLEIIMEPRGSDESPCIVKTGYDDFRFGAICLEPAGINGLTDNSSDGLEVRNNKFSYTGNKPQCLTFYQWLGTGNFNPKDDNAKLIYAYAPNVTKRIPPKLYDAPMPFTKGILKKIWDKRSEISNLPGYGYVLEMKLPGHQSNDRITLNDFNLRHLIQSNQTGMGSLTEENENQIGFGIIGDKTLHLHLEFDAGLHAFNVNHPDWNNSDAYSRTFTVPNTVDYNRYAMNDAAFPDLYDFNSAFPDEDEWIQRQINFNALPDDSTTDSRAGILFDKTFNTSSITNDPSYPDNLLDSSYRESGYVPEFLKQAAVPKWNNQEPRAGFFASDKFFEKAGNPSDLTKSESKADANAVLFDIPEEKPLSMLQFRHANLNTYLHGPTYSLGNSYATTQVARHRSWGRVQTIEHEPTSVRGLTPSMMQEMEEKQAIFLEDVQKEFEPSNIGRYVVHNWGAQDGAAYNWINHDIDFNRGFSAWRMNESGSQLNHQNTTLDHSYYLNRALLDGYFLSGIAQNKKPSAVTTAKAGEKYRPFLNNFASGQVGNHRIVGYFRKGNWMETSYGALSSDVTQGKDDVYRYQSVAGDVLVDGSFNINSTSVDAWIAQLSSLRNAFVMREQGDNQIPINTTDTTPIIRFTKEPSEENSWNQFRKLSDKEIAKLAKSMVKQVKLAGPFLSYSDFVNRRLALGPQNPDKAKGSGQNFVTKSLEEWADYPENRYTVTGLRGPVQNAIAESGLNDFTNILGEQNAGFIPTVPATRWNDNTYTLDVGQENERRINQLNTNPFGLHASSMQEKLWNGIKKKNKESIGLKREWGAGVTEPGFEKKKGLPAWDAGVMNDLFGIPKALPEGSEIPNMPSFSRIKGYKFRPDKYSYDTTKYGEAPENLLAVEHLATGANKPGWVMQADLLSPMAPVTSARSDTFTVRVMGESGKDKTSNAWIELVVQRTPDYVKPDLDAPHHRPHELFKDKNFNGYWDNGYNEHWIDLNRNGDNKEYPDLPGDTESKYRDGMASDLRLEMDQQEEDIESEIGLSFLGINQRFGRKFKIVRFRWLRANEV